MTNTSTYIHQDLVQKAQSFDRSAQGKLYGHYFKAMYNTSLRIVGDEYQAEDIMQDAFIDGFKNIEALKEPSQFGAWLKKIVINKSLNQVNRSGIISEKLNQFDLEIEVQGEDDFGAEVAEIKRAMKSLAKQYQIIFSLYLIEGYDHDEIGEILGISASTSRSQLSRAKKKVKDLIEQKQLTT